MEGHLIETPNEVVGSSKLLKQKSSRADRCALQEAQRAIKAAAKEAGEGSKNPAASGAPKQGKAVKPPSQKKDVTQIAATAASEKKPSDRFLEKDRKKDAPLPRMRYDDKHMVEKAKRRAVVNHFEARNRVELFIHLPQYEHATQLPDLESKFFQLEPMHPSMYKL